MRQCVVQRTADHTYIAVMVQAFISIDLNYCKSALYGITDDLCQRPHSVQKCRSHANYNICLSDVESNSGSHHMARVQDIAWSGIAISVTVI